MDQGFGTWFQIGYPFLPDSNLIPTPEKKESSLISAKFTWDSWKTQKEQHSPRNRWMDQGGIAGAPAGIETDGQITRSSRIDRRETMTTAQQSFMWVFPLVISLQSNLNYFTYFPSHFVFFRSELGNVDGLVSAKYCFDHCVHDTKIAQSSNEWLREKATIWSNWSGVFI